MEVKFFKNFSLFVIKKKNISKLYLSKVESAVSEIF